MLNQERDQPTYDWKTRKNSRHTLMVDTSPDENRHVNSDKQEG